MSLFSRSMVFPLALTLVLSCRGSKPAKGLYIKKELLLLTTDILPCASTEILPQKLVIAFMLQSKVVPAGKPLLKAKSFLSSADLSTIS